jgi:Holliday junction resolvasome RuvABC DNA-binding subunit
MIAESQIDRLGVCLSVAPRITETAMSDNKQATGQDRKLISLAEPYEVRDWTKSLGYTEDELKKAVQAVGHSADKVREYLKKK